MRSNLLALGCLLVGLVLIGIAALYLIEPIRILIQMARFQASVQLSYITIEGVNWWLYLARAAFLFLIPGLALVFVAARRLRSAR